MIDQKEFGLGTFFMLNFEIDKIIIFLIKHILSSLYGKMECSIEDLPFWDQKGKTII